MGSKAAAEGNAIGFYIIRKASCQGEVEADGDTQQEHQRRKKIGSVAISAAQVGSRHHWCPPVEDRTSRRRKILVV
jgi:hypothetical protein